MTLKLDTVITFDPDVHLWPLSTQNDRLDELYKIKKIGELDRSKKKLINAVLSGSIQLLLRSAQSWQKQAEPIQNILDWSKLLELEKNLISKNFEWLYFLPLEKRCWGTFEHGFSSSINKEWTPKALWRRWMIIG